MSVDRAIQISHVAGKVMPTLRIYGWSEPTLTLGRFQAIKDVDFDAAAASDIVVVRRPTGGRGVLHFDEVTYSVVAGLGDGVPQGVTPSYAWILRALVATFRRLGIAVAQPSRKREHHNHSSAACYGGITPADLAVDMKKLSGSAQVWLEDTVLQHGSLVIARDVRKEAELLRLDPLQTEALIASTSTISTICRSVPTHQTLRLELIAGFTEVLGVRFEQSSLSEEENSIAAEIHGQFNLMPERTTGSSSSSTT